MVLELLKFGWEVAFDPVNVDFNMNSNLNWVDIQRICNQIPRYSCKEEILEDLKDLIPSFESEGLQYLSSKQHFLIAKEMIERLFKNDGIEKRKGLEIIYHVIFGYYKIIKGSN